MARYGSGIQDKKTEKPIVCPVEDETWDFAFLQFAATEPLLPDAPPRFRRGGGQGQGIPRPSAGRGAPPPQNRRCPLASSSRGSIELANWHEGRAAAVLGLGK
jgi:hypothetical protein